MPANDLFLRACRGESTERVPVWFMRQAGRSLPEYRKIRERHSLLDICRTPDLATEVTLQPVRRLGVDAAILFSDLVIPLVELGVSLDVVPGKGPVIDRPIGSATDIERLGRMDPAGVPYVNRAIELLVAELDVPLIGFAGAPFTLATYLIEGGPARDHAVTRALMYEDPAAWAGLMDVLCDAVVTYLDGQIAAGAHAVQIFDSWIGDLPPRVFDQACRPWLVKLFKALEGAAVPTIYFGIGTGELLESFGELGVNVIGVDWRVPLREARRRCGEQAVLQGNLDPAAVLAPWPVVRSHADEVLEQGGGRKHIFNLGHGVLPQSDPDTLARLVRHVHEWKPRD